MKKKLSIINKEHKSDFITRRPFWAYRPPDYKDKTSFNKLINILNKKLGELPLQSLDDNIGNVMDNFIIAEARKGILSIKYQHLDHQDFISSYERRCIGDISALKSLRELVVEAIIDNKNHQIDLETKIKKEEFMR